MLQQTSIKVYLLIFGDAFDPNVLTNLVELTPTAIGIKGQAVDEKGINYKDTFWEFSVGPLISLSFEEVCDILLDAINGSESIVFQFMKVHNLSAKFVIVVEIADGQAPALYFNRTFLKTIEQLEAEIDIDMYVL